MLLRLINTFLVITFVSASVFAKAANSKPNEESFIIRNVDIRTWPEGITASEILEIYIELMNQDPEVKSLLDAANKKLQTQGIDDLRGAFKFCEGEAKGNVSAYFSQQTNIVETKIAIPGLIESPWSAKALEAQKNGYGSKVIKSPFLEFLVVNDRPYICIYKDTQVLGQYDTTVHEMVHLVNTIPFSDYDDFLASDKNVNFYDKGIFGPGGEFEAFKIGVAAEVRFKNKYNIKEFSMAAQYFNADGKLVDEEGLKKHIEMAYSDYYKSPGGVLDSISKSMNSIAKYKLYYLYFARPTVQKSGQIDLEKALNDEISYLETFK